MIKDKPNRLVIWFVTTFVGPYLSWFYNKVNFLQQPEVKEDQAVLMIMNHFSFNDGMVLHKLATCILKKRFKVMSVEAQLRRFIALRYIGAFSINKKSKSVIESLNYAVELLKDPKNMLGIYPQGGVYSMHLNRIHFEKGLGHIFKKSRDINYQIVFGVKLVDYLDYAKPFANVYMQVYSGERNLEKIEEAYNRFYTQCKIDQQHLHHPPDRVIDRLDED